jgi:hypothetical protein
MDALPRELALRIALATRVLPSMNLPHQNPRCH